MYPTRERTCNLNFCVSDNNTNVLDRGRPEEYIISYLFSSPLFLLSWALVFSVGIYFLLHFLYFIFSNIFWRQQEDLARAEAGRQPTGGFAAFMVPRNPPRPPKVCIFDHSAYDAYHPPESWWRVIETRRLVSRGGRYFRDGVRWTTYSLCSTVGADVV